MLALVALALTPAAPPDVERLPPPRAVRFDADGDRLPDGEILRLGSTRRRHGACRSVVWSANGTGVVTAGWRDVKTWDSGTGKQRAFPEASLTNPNGFIVGPRAGAISADGRRYVVPTEEHLVVRDAATDEVLTRIPHGPSSDYSKLALSATGGWLAAGWPNGFFVGGVPARPYGVTLYRTAHGAAVALDNARFAKSVGGIAFSPDRSRLFVGTFGESCCYDTKSGKTLWTGAVCQSILAVSGDGRRFVGSDFKGKLEIRDAATGKPLDVPQPDAGTFAAALSADGGRLAYALEDEVVVRDV